MSLSAPRDNNRVPTLIGVDSSQFLTPTTIAVDPITHAVLVEATFTGSQSVEITDGTNIANILKSDGTAAGQNAQLVSGTFLEKSGSASSLNADIIASFDA